jgi:hypothetical protein
LDILTVLDVFPQPLLTGALGIGASTEAQDLVSFLAKC